MIAITLVLAIVFILGLGAGFAVLLIVQRRRTAKVRDSARKTKSEKSISFRWRYILLPVGILIVSVIMTAFFYRLLPAEVAYNFKGDSPDNWISRDAIIAWTLLPQLLLALLSAAIVLGITRLSKQFQQVDDKLVKKVLPIMGNMVALPQLILSFAMLDIFSYNAYQTHLIPLWVFAMIVMVVGGIILGIFLISAIRGVWWRPGQPPPNASRSNND